jgi:hypothetical protein
VHPVILESLAQQRLDDLRASSGSSRKGRSRKSTNRTSPQSPGPMGRAQARIGVWMVDTGSRLVAHGAGSSASAKVAL